MNSLSECYNRMDGPMGVQINAWEEEESVLFLQREESPPMLEGETVAPSMNKGVRECSNDMKG